MCKEGILTEYQKYNVDWIYAGTSQTSICICRHFHALLHSKLSHLHINPCFLTFQQAIKTCKWKIRSKVLYIDSSFMQDWRNWHSWIMVCKTKPAKNHSQVAIHNPLYLSIWITIFRMDFTSDKTMMHIIGVLQSTMFHTAHLVYHWAMVNWIATSTIATVCTLLVLVSLIVKDWKWRVFSLGCLIHHLPDSLPSTGSISWPLYMQNKRYPSGLLRSKGRFSHRYHAVSSEIWYKPSRLYEAFPILNC